MNRIRRHRWCTPLALLVMLALVWTQVVVASHPACALGAMASSPAQVHSMPAVSAPEHTHHAQATLAEEAPTPCHGTAVSDEEPLCASHCSQGGLSKDAPRALSVPVLGPLQVMHVLEMRQLPDAAGLAVAMRPHGAWHRPTAHPASLLLI